MPFLARCALMVQRGEVRSFSDAVKKLRPKRETAPKDVPPPRELRLPYID
jgi:hypothetical protein